MREEFLIAAKDVVRRFNEARKEKPVRIVSHLDCDGLSSAAIMSMALNRAGIKFSMSFVKYLDKNILDELAKEPYEIFIFTDIGSGYIKSIDKQLDNKTVFVLDHHIMEETKTKVVQLNPHLNGIEDYAEISGAGIAYFFARGLDEKNEDLAYIAIIGAIGDTQERNGFNGLNKIILEDAIRSAKIAVSTGLKFFGTQTRPLHKALEYSIEPYIPNVTGNEDGAITFLKSINIELRNADNSYKKLVDLDEEEMKKLVTGIILSRLGSEEKPEDIFGPVYTITAEEEGTAMRDAKEYATLLNCCARLGKPSLGVSLFFNSKKSREEAANLLILYKKEIINSLGWFHKNRKTNCVIEKQGYTIINAEDHVRDTLIGTITSMIAKSNIYEGGSILLSMAHSVNETKVSARLAGDKNTDIRSILQKIVNKLGNYIVGGHKTACGAVIPQEREFEFIKIADQILSKAVLEENISI